jgi:hypothetical protein
LLEGQQSTGNMGNRTKKYLRGLNFSFIKNSYDRNLSNSASKRKFQVAMYLVPGLVAFGLSVSNYLQQSFGIYLKYQAMVDSYYLMQKKQAGDKDASLSIITDNSKAILQSI